MNEFEKIIKDLKWEYKGGTESGYFLLNCPLAPWTHYSKKDNNPSCYATPKHNWWKCYSCGYRGQLFELFELYNKFSGSNINYERFELYIGELFNSEEEKTNVVLYPELLNNFDPLPQQAIDYLTARNISEKSIEKYNLLWDSTNNNVVCSVYNNEGLVGLTGRNIYNKFHHHYLSMWTTAALLGFQFQDKDRILIVEGLTDLLNCWEWAEELNFNVYATFTCSMSNWQARQLLYTGKPIHIAYDQDKPGRDGAYKALRLLKDNYNVTLQKWTPRDLDIGGMSKEAFFKV